VQATEGLEQLPGERGIEPGAVVAHVVSALSACAIAAELDAPILAVRGELPGVREQVLEHDAHETGIGVGANSGAITISTRRPGSVRCKVSMILRAFALRSRSVRCTSPRATMDSDSMSVTRQSMSSPEAWTRRRRSLTSGGSSAANSSRALPKPRILLSGARRSCEIE
jgi:hypothetical protein